jgi:hypothetical protein
MSVGELDMERLVALILMAESGSFGSSSGGALASLTALFLSLAIQALGGAAVFVYNTGVSAEIGDKPSSFGSLGSSFGSVSDYESGSFRLEDDVRGYGPVMFDDNQVTLQLRERDPVRSAILIVTLDDLSMQDNQCTYTGRSPMLNNATVAGWSARVIGNRFREIPGSVSLSATTFGLMNMTVHNQATHCLRVVGVVTTDAPNHVQIEAVTGRPCDELKEEVHDVDLIGEMPSHAAIRPNR